MAFNLRHYNVDMMFYEDAIGVFYDRELNIFTDEDGDPIFNINEIVDPSDILVFKHHKKDMVIACLGQKDVVVELYYPITDEED